MNKTNQNTVESEDQGADAEKNADLTANAEHQQAEINESDAENVAETTPDSDETQPDPVKLLETEVQQLKDTLLRRTAEFENIKKRMLRERMELLEGAKVEALKNFLPVNDDLKRTLLAAEGQEIPEGFLQGISMVAEKFANILNAAGVEPINDIGVPFDVNIHDALMRQVAPDKSTPSDTVLQVLEPGYKAGDKVIRHAKVIVSE
jgi:molecular chaperone GrpE